MLDALLLSGCKNAEAETNVLENIELLTAAPAEPRESVKEVSMALSEDSVELSVPEPFDYEGCGDYFSDYYSLCSPLLSGIPYELISKVGTDEFEKWIRSFDPKKLSADIADHENLYSFICRFNLDDETVREVLKKEQKLWQENNICPNYTDEQIEIILSRDKDLIAETFINETAIYSNGEIFTPDWLYNSSTYTWKKKNIPAEELYEKASLILAKLPFNKEGAEYFAGKCSEYCGRKIEVSDNIFENNAADNEGINEIDGVEELIGEAENIILELEPCDQA